MEKIASMVLLLVLFINPLIRADDRGVLLLKEKKSLVRDGERTPRFTSRISKKNLLGLRREGTGNLPLFKMTQAEVETINVLALKVGFQRETPDDSQTTGDGWFDLRRKEEFRQQEHHLTDPAPHDSFYFAAHFKALNQYWERVSKGKLVLVWDIYPKDSTLTYTLPNSMSYYGCVGSSGDSLYKMLSQLFYDSFRLADSLSLNDPDSTRYRFGRDYDAFMIFHAGADRQNDYGDSPCDLMTGFINLIDTVWAHAQGGDSMPITEGMIMPETASQDEEQWGSPWSTYLAIAMNAVFAHEFGHQLGLPDFYNTLTFMTQVGNFSLMDNNASNIASGVSIDSDSWLVSGAMPVYPDAWCRAYLGFVGTTVVDTDSLGDMEILASELISDTIQMVKVPINSDEYFLLENRRTDLDGIGDLYLKLDSLTDVILYPIDGVADTFNAEYDFFIPGSGLLIWHIDEGVAYLDYDDDGENNFQDNQLQRDKNRRFVSIVEADGIIDFGGDYYTGFGLQEDMFYLGNNNSFTPYTFPASLSNTKANSHIFVTNISRPKIQMSCDVFYEWYEHGWKQKVSPQSNPSSLVYADVDNDDSVEIFLSSGNKIYGWRSNGNKIVDNDSIFLQTNLNESIDTLPLAIFSIAESTIVGPPSLGDLNGDDTLEVVAGDLSGRLYVWSIKDIYGGDGLADILSGFPIELGGWISCVPVISDFDIDNEGLEVFIGTDLGKWYIVSFSGSVVDSGDFGEKVVGLATTDIPNMNFVITLKGDSAHLWNTIQSDFRISIDYPSSSIPVSGDLNRDGKWEVVVVGGGHKLYAWDENLNPLVGFPVDLNWAIAPILGDVDGDGYLEVVVAGENRILAYNYNGTLVTEFPLVVDRNKNLGWIKSIPILADINDQRGADIIFGTGDREVMAFEGDGKKIDGFPLSCGGGIYSSAAILNLDQDQNLELLAVADDGFVYAWDLATAFDFTKLVWSMYGYDERHTNSFPLAMLPPLQVPGELMPDRSVYNYPNPAKEETFIRYFLSKDAQVEIRIYDLAGDLVFKTAQSGLGQTDNEYQWDCSKFASGVYICQVRAKSQDEEKVTSCKIALLK